MVVAQQDHRMYWIDVLRGIAALIVALMHWLWESGLHNQIAVYSATSAVVAFFVLSGLVTDRTLHYRTVQDFWQRRALRLTPAWLVALCLFWLLGQLHGPFWHDIFWALPIEVLWYMLAPLLMKQPLTTLLLLMPCLVLWSYALPVLPAVLLPGMIAIFWYLPFFLVGVLLNRARQQHGWRNVAIGTLALMIFLAASPIVALNALTYAIAVLIVVCMAFLCHTGEPAWPAWFVWLGTVSYGIYLYHLVPAWVFSSWPLLWLPATLLLALVSWRWLEKPLLDRNRRRERTPKPAPSIPAAPGGE